MPYRQPLGNMLKDDSTMKGAEIDKCKLNNNMTVELTELYFYTHSTKNDNGTISPASHFLKFLCQSAFGTFAKPHKPTHNQSFAKEPNFPNALGQLLLMKHQLIWTR